MIALVFPHCSSCTCVVHGTLLDHVLRWNAMLSTCFQLLLFLRPLLVRPFLTGCESNRRRTEQAKPNAQFISCRLCSIDQKVKLIPANLFSFFLSYLVHTFPKNSLILSCLVSLTMIARLFTCLDINFSLVSDTCINKRSSCGMGVELFVVCSAYYDHL